MIENYFQTTSAKQRIAMLNEELSNRKKAMAELHAVWDLNQAMRDGKQWSFYVQGRGIVDLEARQPKARKRYRVNFINLWNRNMVSLLTQQAPVINVKPSTETPDDRQKAEAGNRIWEHHKRANHYSELASLRVNDMLFASTGWTMVSWDPSFGEVIGVDRATNKEVKEGRIVWRRVHPRCCFPNTEATTLDELTDIFVEWVLPIPLIRKLWPKTSKNIKPMDGIADYRHFQQVNLPGVPEPHKYFKNHALIREWRVHGTVMDGNRPRGYIVQWCNNEELWEGDGLWKDGSLGLVPCRFCPTGENIFGKTYIEELIDPQVNFNKTLSQLILYREKIVAGRYIAEKNSLSSSDALTSDVVGDTIFVNPGRKWPAVMQVQDIGQSVYQELDLTMRLMQDLGSQQEVMRGASQPEVRSYLQTSALLEQANRTLGGTISEIERADAEIARLTLMLVQDRWPTERMVSVAGEDVTAGVLQLKGADLPTYIDIDYVPGSAMPKSRAAEFEEFRLLLSTNLFDPNLRQVAPQLHQRLISTVSSLEYGGMRKLTEYERLHSSNAQRENQRLLSGANIEVREFEDHEIHTYEHNLFRNSAQYQSAPTDQRMLMDQHCEIHDLAFQFSKSGQSYTMADVMAKYEQANAQQGQGQPQEVPQGMPPGMQMPVPQEQGGVGINDFAAENPQALEAVG